MRAKLYDVLDTKTGVMIGERQGNTAAGRGSDRRTCRTSSEHGESRETARWQILDPCRGRA